MYAALKAARLRKTPVGASALVGFSLRHIPAHRKPTVCFIRWAGTSYTTGTLFDIIFELVGNVIDKYNRIIYVSKYNGGFYRKYT